MNPTTQIILCLRWLNRHWPLISCVVLIFAFHRLAVTPVLADGCFVFKWNKEIDINEPTQKAIIVYHDGRQDLLLQVKYEGPLQEFGWLIPVPALPKVEKGSMEAFYELSQLTQRQFGMTKGNTLGVEASRGRGAEPPVKVIEIKTVGAYEVAVLSARDSGSLARWLKTHDYSIPEGKSEIVEDYIRRGWYFIAAKILLNKGVGFKTALNADPKDSPAANKGRKTLQKQLADGELHPLLISFDTPKCVFPLKISSVGGKPSEVSLYVLSSEPLLNKFIFDKACEKLDKESIAWEEEKPKREASRETMRENMQMMGLAYQMYSANSSPGIPQRRGRARNWSIEDLAAISKESQPESPLESLGETFRSWPVNMLQTLRVTSGKIPQSAKVLPRLKNKDWYLTKLVWTFAPEEMHDLDFQPAIPAVAKMLSRPAGGVAAQLLSQFGSTAVPILINASKSANPTKRVNAAFGFEQVKDQRLVEPLLDLLKDEIPQVRLHALRSTERNWDKRFIEPLIALFHDPHPEIRAEASGCLSRKESAERSPTYLALLKDSDPNVRVHALQVLSQINPKAIPQATLVEMVKDPNPDVHSSAMHVVWRTNQKAIPRSELLPLLGSTQMQTVSIAWQLLKAPEPVQSSVPFLDLARGQPSGISSGEAVPLLTNKLTMARFIGLKILQQNADAKAVELTLPLLRHTNSVIRSRAFTVIQSVSGEKFSEEDAAPWEQWWILNKETFDHRKSK